MAKKADLEVYMRGAEYWLWQKREAFQQVLLGLFFALDGGSFLTLAVAAHRYNETVDGRLKGENGQFWRHKAAGRLVDPMTPAASHKRKALYARAARKGAPLYPKG